MVQAELLKAEILETNKQDIEQSPRQWEGWHVGCPRMKGRILRDERDKRGKECGMVTGQWRKLEGDMCC